MSTSATMTSVDMDIEIHSESISGRMKQFQLESLIYHAFGKGKLEIRSQTFRLLLYGDGVYQKIRAAFA